MNSPLPVPGSPTIGRPSRVPVLPSRTRRLVLVAHRMVFPDVPVGRLLRALGFAGKLTQADGSSSDAVELAVAHRVVGDQPAQRIEEGLRERVRPFDRGRVAEELENSA